MFRKHMLTVLLMLVSLALVLSLSSTLSFAQPEEQVIPPSEWIEGQQMTSNLTQSQYSLAAVPTTPGTTYKTFSGMAFSPTNSSLTYSAQGGAVYATALPPGGYSFSLELDLPQGATITEVVFFVVDNDATYDMSLGLWLYNPETNAFTSLESTASTGASTLLQTIVMPVSPPIQVDNTTTSYRLRVAPGVASSAHLLRGARIGYIVSQVYLPSVLK